MNRTRSTCEGGVPSKPARTGSRHRRFDSIGCLLLITFILGSAPVHADDTDWIVEIANSTIARQPNAAAYAWNWGEAVLMYGMWKAFETTGNNAYFNYVKTWVDRYVDQNGNLNLSSIGDRTYVNKVAGGILLVVLYQQTSDTRYATAANQLAVYATTNIPRVYNGAFAHTNDDQLWIDTLYMTGVFLSKWGVVSGSNASLDEAVKQIITHAEIQFDPDHHLFYHG